jgi:hypothetical protein
MRRLWLQTAVNGTHGMFNTKTSYVSFCACKLVRFIWIVQEVSLPYLTYTFSRGSLTHSKLPLPV